MVPRGGRAGRGHALGLLGAARDGGGRAGFFLLYSFVVFLSMLGENLPVMLVGSGLVFAANFVSESPATMFTSAHLLHLVFLYTVALFYGHVLARSATSGRAPTAASPGPGSSR